METVQSQTTGSPNAISQAAAVVALSHSASLVEPMLRAYRKRHLLLCDRLSDIPGLRFIPSEGSFYLFVNVADAISNLYRSGILEASSDTAFSEYLLEHHGLAVVPGTVFGSPGHLRLSFAVSEDQIIEAAGRLKRACAAHLT